MDVNHHVTRYTHIINDLQCQLQRLRSELESKTTADTASSSEVRDLCQRLRALAQEQRELR